MKVYIGSAVATRNVAGHITNNFKLFVQLAETGKAFFDYMVADMEASFPGQTYQYGEIATVADDAIRAAAQHLDKEK